MSVRDGWFCHPDQLPKSVEALTEICFGSVGRTAVLLRNVPPDTAGRLPDTDAARPGEFRERIGHELPATSPGEHGSPAPPGRGPSTSARARWAASGRPRTSGTAGRSSAAGWRRTATVPGGR